MPGLWSVTQARKCLCGEESVTLLAVADVTWSHIPGAGRYINKPKVLE